MNEASVPALTAPIPPVEADESIPTLMARLRAYAATATFREDLRFFLLVYVLGFILFTSWLA